jgi:predicted PhzF superfamily epimerase YddE/YHI9
VQIPVYHVAAFANQPFAGNPAAVCVLESWLPDATLQALATAIGLPATAFLIKHESTYSLRCFAPIAELDLCGHATIAAATVVFEVLDRSAREVRFATRSAAIPVSRTARGLRLDLRAREAVPHDLALSDVSRALGRRPVSVWSAEDLLVVYGSERDVLALQPDAQRIASLGAHIVIATARGRTCDFVSRVFAPLEGVLEDQGCGSAHSILLPYWARRLASTRLSACQLSRRGAELHCELAGERVWITGQAVIYLEGILDL